MSIILSIMIKRDLSDRLLKAAHSWPSITLTGPRQSGKTTLCRTLFPQHPYVTLEALDVRIFATEDPRAFLAQFPEGAILDEIQRAPNLLSYLQGIIDEDPAPGRWVLTGSQNLALLESVSQSLAGRTAVHNLLPLSRGEATRFPSHPLTIDESLFTGSYPRIFDENLDPAEWLRSYATTYIERDVRLISNVNDLPAFQRFIALCAGRTAQLLNYSSLAADCGISQPTAKAWLGLLEAGFLVFRLPAHRANIRKRLVKMPKLHFYDTGLVCWLLGIRTSGHLRSHPLRGPIFETWLVSEIAKQLMHQGDFRGLGFYRDKNGVEADLVVGQPPDLALIEAKSAATAPTGVFAGISRVRNHLGSSARHCPGIVVYGGGDPQRRGIDSLIPWHELHKVDWEAAGCVVAVRSAGRPVVGANVLALFPNKTWKAAATNESGTAALDLHSAKLPMNVFVAAEGHGACLKLGWIPGDGPLDIELSEQANGGAVIFRDGAGDVPGLNGRLHVGLGSHGVAEFRAANIAINDGVPQPHPFECEEDLRLTDSDGHSMIVRVVATAGPVVLLQYHRA